MDANDSFYFMRIDGKRGNLRENFAINSENRATPQQATFDFVC